VPEWQDFKTKARTEKWTMDEFMHEVVQEELARLKNDSARSLVAKQAKQRRAADETLNKPGNPPTNTHKPESPNPGFKVPTDIWPKMHRSEKIEFWKIKDSKEKEKWFNSHRKEITNRRVIETTTAVTTPVKEAEKETLKEDQPDPVTPKPSGPKKTVKVNWSQKLKGGKNRRFGDTHFESSLPYALIDSGADTCSMHQGWHITHRYEHGRISLGGAQELQATPVQMDLASGMSKIRTLEGDMIIRIHQGVAPLEGTTPVVESLINPDQLRNMGIIVDDVPHLHGGRQCIIIPCDVTGEYEVIIPLTFFEGHTILFLSVPTQEEINALPIIDITSKEAWMPRSHPKCDFDFDQFMSNKWSGMLQGNIHPEYLERWKSQLYTTDADVVHKTLDATTQLAIIEPRTSTDLPIQHEKKETICI